MSAGKTFVDTNILVYAHDRDAGRKRQIAQEHITALAGARAGTLSMQVLQEFYVTATRKIGSPLPRNEARGIVDDFSHWCILTGPEDIRRAFRIEEEARINFWDALIVASAVAAGATRILSEDLNPRQTIAGIMIENPFL